MAYTAKCRLAIADSLDQVSPAAVLESVTVAKHIFGYQVVVVYGRVVGIGIILKTFQYGVR